LRQIATCEQSFSHQVCPRIVDAAHGPSPEVGTGVGIASCLAVIKNSDVQLPHR